MHVAYTYTYACTSANIDAQTDVRNWMYAHTLQYYDTLFLTAPQLWKKEDMPTGFPDTP